MARKSVRDIFKKILLSFRRNWGLKLISLFFAILVWNYVIVMIDPGHTITVRNITLGQPSGLAQLESTGLTLKGGVTGYLKNASVDIFVHRSDEAQLKQNGGVRVWASIDLSGITQEGQQSVKVSYTTSVGTVKNYSPDTISVTVEKLEKRAVPVVCETTGALPQGYWCGPPQVNPQVLQISGAVSDVERVQKAVVQAPLDNLTSNFTAACDFALIDASGGTVSSADLVPDPPNCIVNIPVLPTKTVPIDAGNSLSGSPAYGYEVQGAPQLSANTIEIAAPADVLSGIGSLALGSVDISGKSGDVSIVGAVELPQGVQAVSGDSVTVLVKIGLKMVTRTVSGLPIAIKTDAGLKPDKTYTGSVSFLCPELSVPNLKLAFFHLVADATGRGAGSQTMTVTASYDDASAGLTDFVPDPAQVTVKLVSAAT